MGRRRESFPRSRTRVAAAGTPWCLANRECAAQGPASTQHLRVPEDAAQRPTPPGSPEKGAGKRRPGVGSWIRDVQARTSGVHSEASNVLEENTAGAHGRTAGPRRVISSSALAGGARMALRLPRERHPPARPHAPGPSRSGPARAQGGDAGSGPPLPPHRADARAAPSAAQGTTPGRRPAGSSRAVPCLGCCLKRLRPRAAPGSFFALLCPPRLVSLGASEPFLSPATGAVRTRSAQVADYKPD